MSAVEFRRGSPSSACQGFRERRFSGCPRFDLTRSAMLCESPASRRRPLRCFRPTSVAFSVARADFGERLALRAGRVGIILTRQDLHLIEQYYFLLERWNRRINLTSLPLHDFPDATIDRLLIEPLVAAPFVDEGQLRWFDLGSGGGSPAIPLKVLRPRAGLTLVESRSRKAAFLREVVRRLELADTSVLTERFEELAQTKAAGRADLVTVRAVRMDDEFFAAMATLLRAEGRLLLFGSQAPSTLPVTGFRLVEAIKVPATGASIRLLQKLA